MSNAHVSDEEIQRYTFDRTNCNQNAMEHIRSCETCKTIAASYSGLSMALKAQPKPQLHYNLAENVLKRVPVLDQKVSYDYMQIGAWVILAIGVITISLYMTQTIIFNLVNNKHLTTYFILSIGIFTTVLWCLDMVKTFNNKMKIIYLS